LEFEEGMKVKTAAQQYIDKVISARRKERLEERKLRRSRGRKETS